MRSRARILTVAALTALAIAPVAAAERSVPDTMAQRALACTGCHGQQGRSKPDGYVPRLAGKPAGYLLAQLHAFQDGRRMHQGMAALLEPLDDGMLAALAEHFAALAVPYPAPVRSTLSEEEARHARRLVVEGDAARRVPACGACHGRALTGVAPQVPGLLGLPSDYITAQIGAWRAGHRHASTPDCMGEIAGRLQPADIALVARWLAAQPVPAHPRPAERPPGEWPMTCASVSR